MASTLNETDAQIGTEVGTVIGTDSNTATENTHAVASAEVEVEKSPVAADNTADEKPAEDEFSYLQRNEFTSEIYKVEVRNLGYFGIGEFKKLLKKKLNLDISKIKTPSRKEFAFICFRSQADQERAIQMLNGYKWKGKELQAYAAKASADPLMKRRNESKENGVVKTKRKRTCAEVVCPLAYVPYEQQLKQKSIEMESLIKKYFNELCHINSKAKEHLKEFKFKGVMPSPQIRAYRNKNEFTVGKNHEGELIVGFRLSSYSDGSVEVADVDSLPHIPEEAKWAALTFQEFVRSSSFEPFSPVGNSGHLRQLMVRTSATTGEIMLVVGIYSSNLTAEQLEKLKTDLIEFYAAKSANASEKYKCTSLYYQDVKHREAGQTVNPVEHLSGTTHITDRILELDFRISPLAFFQVNTSGASVLYQQAIELAAPTSNSTVLDICCGTGTISLAFAKHCKRVLGVEIIPDAIKDADYNAESNKITNCKFFAGNADDYIKSMVREAIYDTAVGAKLELVAVVDPPRPGLHNRSIAAIRAATDLKRLVYMSCDPERTKRNWLELSRPESKQYKGDPFYPKTAVAVDMFPHTKHCELIVLFERDSNQTSTTAATPVGDEVAAKSIVDDEVAATSTVENEVAATPTVEKIEITATAATSAAEAETPEEAAAVLNNKTSTEEV